jgi:hypothetical protein
MNQNENKFDKRWKVVFDSLFGNIEEMDGPEAEEILRSAGIDYESVRRKMYDKLAQSATALRLEQKAVSEDIQQALNAFRPLDAPPRSEDEAKKQARGIIDRFFGKAIEGQPTLRFALSYRNRGELTEADVKLLDSVVDKLKKQIGQLG